MDKGFFYTVKELSTRPGDSIREYLAGKRINHYRAISFLLVASTLYALVAYWLGLGTVLSDSIGGMIEGMTNDGEDQALALSYVVVGLKWLGAHPSYFSLVLFPVFSLASFLSFNSAGYNYFEHLILNAYLTGQQALVFLLFLPIIYVIGENDAVSMLELFCAVSLTFWTYISFFKGKTTLSKVLLTMLSYILYFVLLIMIILFAFIFLTS